MFIAYNDFLIYIVSLQICVLVLDYNYCLIYIGSLQICVLVLVL